MTDNITQTTKELSTKAGNLEALLGGLKMDFSTEPHTERANSLLNVAQIRAAQLKDALDVLAMEVGKP